MPDYTKFALVTIITVVWAVNVSVRPSVCPSQTTLPMISDIGRKFGGVIRCTVTLGVPRSRVQGRIQDFNLGGGGGGCMKHGGRHSPEIKKNVVSDSEKHNAYIHI